MPENQKLKKRKTHSLPSVHYETAGIRESLTEKKETICKAMHTLTLKTTKKSIGILI